jgi:hypothetical protein
MLFIKQKSLVLFLLHICIQTYSQKDSTQRESNVYKNNIQTNLSGFAGYFSLQYERALNNHFSISLVSNFNYPFAIQRPSVHLYKCIFSSQLRYYFNKSATPNNGLYLSAAYGFTYIRQYNPTNSSGHAQYKYSSIGLGIGKQWLIKKRIIADVGAGFFYSFSGKVDFPYDNKGWVRSLLYDHSAQLFLTLNLGYAF